MTNTKKHTPIQPNGRHERADGDLGGGLATKIDRTDGHTDVHEPTLADLRAAIRCRARLRGITEAAARAELIAVGDIPAHRRAA